MNDIYFGVIEDNNDPQKMGRCKVRIVGVHPEDKDILPTEHLPWAIPIMDFSSDANSSSYKPPVKGTRIAGYFQDNTMQMFFMLGTIPVNFTELPDKTKGFNDPDGVYPTRTGPTTNRLARNEEIDETIVKTKKDNVYSGTLFSEPETTYNTEYPHNKVYEDEAGNIVEIDGTPGAERIHVYHSSGSFVEFTNDGIVIKTSGKIYQISGDLNQKSDTLNIEVNGDANIKVSGDLEIDANHTNVK